MTPGLDPQLLPPGFQRWVGDDYDPAADLADVPRGGDDGSDLRAGGPVWVHVAATGAGVWARFTGVDEHGKPVTCSGAVVAGPDLHGDAYAVQIRDYTGAADRIVYVPADGHVELVDDPADYPGRVAHALDPVYAPGADRVDLMEWVPDKKNPTRGRWVWLPSLHDVSEGDLEQLHRDLSGTHRMVVGVHRPHLPIGGA